MPLCIKCGRELKITDEIYLVKDLEEIVFAFDCLCGKTYEVGYICNIITDEKGNEL